MADVPSQDSLMLFQIVLRRSQRALQAWYHMLPRVCALSGFSTDFEFCLGLVRFLSWIMFFVVIGLCLYWVLCFTINSSWLCEINIQHISLITDYLQLSGSYRQNEILSYEEWNWGEIMPGIDHYLVLGWPVKGGNIRQSHTNLNANIARWMYLLGI